MEVFHLHEELHIFYVAAQSFPEGIMDAFTELEDMIGGKGDRVFFGLSKPQNGVIEYRAGVFEDYPGEAEHFGLDVFVLHKGTYLAHTVPDFMNNTPAIGQTFQQLLDDPRLHPDAWCVEWYKNDDVMCMVKIIDAEA